MRRILFLLPFFIISTSRATTADSDSATQVFTSHTITQSTLGRLPIRETSYYLSLLNGIVRMNDALHIRGGREHDLATYINGIPFTNRFSGTPAFAIIPEAIESYTIHPGGAGPAYGYSIGGVTETRLRRGGDRLALGVNIQTDDVVKTGEEFLGTTSFGFRHAVLTAGGPLPVADNVGFFLAAENHYMRNRQPLRLEPMSFDFGIDQLSGRPLPGQVTIARNVLPKNRNERNMIQGTVTYDGLPLLLNLAGGYQSRSFTDGAEWPRALVRVFNQNRTPSVEERTGFLGTSIRQEPAPWIAWNGSVTYYTRNSTTVDPDFGTDWKKYTDSLENAVRGYTGFYSRWWGPPEYVVLDGFRLRHQHSPNTSYSKEAQNAWIVTASTTMRPEEHWSFTLGGDLELWRMRLFNVADIGSFMELERGDAGAPPAEFGSDEERRVQLGRSGRINHYGYTVDGDPADMGVDGPARPTFASAYMEHMLTNNRVRLSAGLRYEHYNPGVKVPENPLDPAMNIQLDVLDEEKFVPASAANHVLPRAGLVYTAGGSTVLRVSFGRYVQMPPLKGIYSGNTYISRTISFSTRGNAFLPPAGFLVRPERSTQYEVSLEQRLASALRVRAGVFHKEMRDQLHVARLGAWSYAAFLNSDESSASGLEIGLEVARTAGIAAQFFYTFSNARGISSTPRSNIGRVEQRLPVDLIFHPLDFQHDHKATLILDGESGDDKGWLLSGLNATVVATFTSGHRYTRVRMPTYGGLTNQWTNGVQSLVDPRTAQPVEPVNQNSTPPTFNVDIRAGKEFPAGPATIEAYIILLNVFDTRHVLNVYPTTGSAQNDGWLANPMLPQWLRNNEYADFYRAINLQNRWAYMSATGNDLYGPPRQIRFGVSARL